MKKISLDRVFTVLGYFKMFIDLFRTIKAKEKSNIIELPQKKKLEEDEPCL